MLLKVDEEFAKIEPYLLITIIDFIGLDREEMSELSRRSMDAFRARDGIWNEYAPDFSSITFEDVEYFFNYGTFTIKSYLVNCIRANFSERYIPLMIDSIEKGYSFGYIIFLPMLITYFSLKLHKLADIVIKTPGQDLADFFFYPLDKSSLEYPDALTILFNPNATSVRKTSGIIYIPNPYISEFQNFNPPAPSAADSS
jgi:hypothetical protein